MKIKTLTIAILTIIATAFALYPWNAMAAALSLYMVANLDTSSGSSPKVFSVNPTLFDVTPLSFSGPVGNPSYNLFPGLSYSDGTDRATDGSHDYYANAGTVYQANTTWGIGSTWLPASYGPSGSSDIFEGGITYDRNHNSLWVAESVDCGSACSFSGHFINEYDIATRSYLRGFQNPAYYPVDPLSPSSGLPRLISGLGCTGLAINPEFNFNNGPDNYEGAFWETCGDWVLPVDISSHAFTTRYSINSTNSEQIVATDFTAINFASGNGGFPLAIEFAPVPEPASAALLAAALIALGMVRSRDSDNRPRRGYS